MIIVSGTRRPPFLAEVRSAPGLTTNDRYDTQMIACMSQCEKHHVARFSNSYAISHVISAAVPCFDSWTFQSLILHEHIRAEMLRYSQLHYPCFHPLLSHRAEFGIWIADTFYSILCMRFTKQDVRERGAVRLLKDARQAHQAVTSTAYPSILPSTHHELTRLYIHSLPDLDEIRRQFSRSSRDHVHL